MRARWGIAGLVVATLIVAPLAYGEDPIPTGPTRAEYAAQVEPICQADTENNTRILKGAKERVRKGKLGLAAGQFIHAAKAFGGTIRSLNSVPRPPEDDARLLKWFKYLRIVQTNLRKIGVALNEGNKVKAIHESIRAERSGNAANNVSSVFNFHYCHLEPSRFR